MFEVVNLFNTDGTVALGVIQHLNTKLDTLPFGVGQLGTPETRRPTV